MRRSILWRKEQPFGAEYAEVTIEGSRLAARGTSVGHPPPYRLGYELETSRDFVTSTLFVTVEGAGWERRLLLRRSQSGVWHIDASTHGDAGLPAPGGDPSAIEGALDCDLGLCPLTNTMPVLRHGLLEAGAPVDLVMAWVAVPQLTVHRSEQRYTHFAKDGERRVVRYEGDGGMWDVVFDTAGLVIHYPELATRIGIA